MAPGGGLGRRRCSACAVHAQRSGSGVGSVYAAPRQRIRMPLRLSVQRLCSVCAASVQRLTMQRLTMQRFLCGASRMGCLLRWKAGETRSPSRYVPASNCGAVEEVMA